MTDPDEEAPTYEELYEDVQHLSYVVGQLMHLLSHIPADVRDDAACAAMACVSESTNPTH